MRPPMRHWRTIVSGILVWNFMVLPVWADPVSQDNTELMQELKELRQLLERQQARIEALEREIARRATPVQAAPPAVSATSPIPSALPGQIGAVLPEIGLVGDIVATSSQESADTEGNDRIAAREVELVVGSYVDPYSRFDATFAFSDFEEAALEEAYLTHWGLPWDLKGRFGRFFPKIGKAAAIHRDQLSTVDEPIIVRRYWGSEGFFRTGADLTHLFEGPGGWVLEPSAGILEGGAGEGGGTFGSTRRRPTVYSHLKAFKDLSDAANVELGLTHLAGSSDADAAFEVNVLGVDATYLNALTPTAKLKLQGEFYLQQRDEAHPWGAYLLADYRFAPRWSVGGRLDHARRIDTAAPRHADEGGSLFLTFHQSEWARWRLQYRHEERANEKTDDAVFLQGTFAIGTHKHQLQ